MEAGNWLTETTDGPTPFETAGRDIIFCSASASIRGPYLALWSLTYVMLPNHRHLYNNFTAMYRPQSVYNILVIAIGSTCCCSIETAYHVTFNGCSLRLASTEFISCMRLNLHNTSSFSLHTIRYKCIHIWNWRFWERGASGSHCGENGVGRRRL